MSLMTVTVERLIEAGVLAPIHQGFADTIRRLDEHGDPLVVLAAALTSEQLGRGHVCLDLDAIRQVPFTAGKEDAAAVIQHDWPSVTTWTKALSASRLVEVRKVADSGDELSRPLVLDRQHGRVYLARYWFCQQQLAARIALRLVAEPERVDEDQIADGIRRLFPDEHSESSRDQCLAVACAVDRRFSVITGGPGTGKTTTVARLLALRLLQHLPPDVDSDKRSSSSRQLLLPLDTSDEPENDPVEAPGLKVLLMAPTGKAAQRLNESLRRAAGSLDVDSRIRHALQNCSAGTIHHMLGWTSAPPEKGGPFRHNAEYPLDADVVLVDEASMVDISLMWRLFDAVRPEAQVILLGDRDQLASVEAGGVLSDLCGEVADESLPASRCEQLRKRTGIEVLPSATAETDLLQESILTLRFSHRFEADSTLGRLAAGIRAGDADGVVELLQHATRQSNESIEWIENTQGTSVMGEIVQCACDGYRQMLERLKQPASSTSDVLAMLSRTRVLCAHRGGRWGETTFNRAIIEQLAADGLIKPVPGAWPGRVVMVTRNDYHLNLFNGDAGVVVATPDESLAVLFEDPSLSNGCRLVPAALVRDSVDCFAMTIHKSQGSEFHRVVVVLPDHDSPVVSRELLYTAVTRVRDEFVSGERQSGQLVIAASENGLRNAIDRPIRRTSGLRDAICSQARRTAGKVTSQGDVPE
jgi:exodeoxyribonuclease V alpha subunit